MKISRRKFVAFALIATALSVGVGLALLLAADLVLHARAEKSAGLNRYGYRGPVVGRKQPGELRMVMLGGSTVFGYGVSWQDAIPAVVERQLRSRLQQPVTVVNLGYNNEGAYAFVPNLSDFAYLDYDVVILYEGYNDLVGDYKPNTGVYRRDSAVYRLTGYFPILPLYLDEKAKMLRYGGDLAAAYAAEGGEKPKTVFRPNLFERTSAGAMETVAAVTNALGEQLGRLTTVPAAAVSTDPARGCEAPWVHYCGAVRAAIDYALARNLRVVVVGQPMFHAGIQLVLAHQQQTVAAMIRRDFGPDAPVRYINLSSAVDLSNPELTFDSMHLTAAGNAIVGEALARELHAFVTR
jgi:hypothetical protein